MFEEIKETTDFLRKKGIGNPEAGVILGTGLGGLTSKITTTVEIDYKDIPHFPVSTVEGHAGKMIYGDFGGKKIIAMKGRFHYYEGYTPEQIALPIRVLKFLGIRYLFLSNAAGGVNPTFQIGDIMIIHDHINLMPNPLIGKNDERIGPRFPDMSQPYDHSLIEKAVRIAGDKRIVVKRGIYLGTPGPTFETLAEYKYFRTIGADAVGMSTVPEVIVARQMGLPCFAVSIITDLGIEGKIEYTTHETIQREAEKAEAKMTTIMTELISSL